MTALTPNVSSRLRKACNLSRTELGAIGPRNAAPSLQNFEPAALPAAIVTAVADVACEGTPAGTQHQATNATRRTTIRLLATPNVGVAATPASSAGRFQLSTVLGSSSFWRSASQWSTDTRPAPNTL